MLIEKGVVKNIDGKFAVVQIERNMNECSSCSLRDACTRKESDFIYVFNSVGAKIGDIVEFEVMERLGWLSMFLFFILPIVFLLIGIIIGNTKDEKFAIITGFIFIGFYFFILFLLEKNIKFKKGFIKMRRIINEGNKDG